MENSEIKQKKIEKIKKAFTRLAKVVDPLWAMPGGGQPTIFVYHGLDYMKRQYFPNGLADDRIIDFLIYQVYRYRESQRLDYRWCFSQQAVDKYYAQFCGGGKGRGMTYYINLWLQENQVTRNQLVEMIADSKENPFLQYLYLHSEEICKQRFLNTEVGYMMCQNNTTGWSPLSETCKQCKFTEQCTNDSERKYPEIIRLRKEHKDHNNGKN